MGSALGARSCFVGLVGQVRARLFRWARFVARLVLVVGHRLPGKPQLRFLGSFWLCRLLTQVH